MKYNILYLKYKCEYYIHIIFLENNKSFKYNRK